MLRDLFRSALLLSVGLALAGCPNNPDGTESAAEQNAEAAVQRGQENAQETMENAQQKAEELGAEAKETAQQTGETIKEGYANFTQDVREKYPKVVESMQKQFDALTSGAEEDYKSSLAEDAPRRDALLAEFKQNAPLKRSYTLETFTVDSASDTEAVATVVLASKNSDPAQPVEDKHASYKYTFRKAADSEDWRIYDIEPLDATAKEAEAAAEKAPEAGATH